jgi:hypothetical protein
MLGVSDMVNPTRGKDAAVARAGPRGLGGGETARWDRREIDGITPPLRTTYPLWQPPPPIAGDGNSRR